MTHHHDELRVAPDPSQAEELRQLLHARLAGGDQRLLRAHRSADTDPDREGDLIMLETEDRPSGQQPPTAGRGSPGRWLLVAAMIAVVAVVGALFVAAAGDDDETQVPATTPPTTVGVPNVMELPEGLSEYRPGRYFVDPDQDETTPLRVTFEVTSDGWTPWPGAYRFRDDALTSFSVTTVTNLTTDACAGPDALEPPVGPTVDDLATALTQLPPFSVAAPPTDVTIDGYSGKHLELTASGLRITGTAGDRQFADCEDGHLYSWISPILGGPYWGYGAVDGLTEEFWILDVDGARLVLTKNDSPGATAGDVAERDAMFDSIQIEP